MLVFYVMDFYGAIYYSENIPVDVSKYTSSIILEKAIDKLPTADDRILAVKLIAGGITVYENARIISKPKHIHLPKPRINVHVSRIRDRVYELFVESDVYVKGLELSLCDEEAFFDDNYFDLIPRSARIVRVYVDKGIDIDYFTKKLRVKAYPYIEELEEEVRILL